MVVKKSRYVPYNLTRLPSQILAATTEWRRNNATSVETEILKPESILPVTTGSSGRSPICFNIKGVPNSHVDGSNIYIETTFSIEKYDAPNWVPSTIEETIIPIANTACSLFEDLNVSINGVLVENTQREFTIKCFIQNILYSTPADRLKWDETALFALDEQKTHETVKPNNDYETGKVRNPGQRKRMKVTNPNKIHTVYSRLMSDALSCSEPLPDNVNITVKLYPAKSEACMVRDKDNEVVYRVKISECSLYIPRISTKTNRSIDRTFTYTNWRTLAYTHQSGQTNFRKDIAVGETLPQKAIVVFMPEDQYNGTWTTSKINLKNSNVSTIMMKCNQRHVPFMNGYQCDFVKDIYKTAYEGLTSELGSPMHPIDYQWFDDGFTIFGFDLTPNKTGNVALENPLRGALELDIQFKPAPTVNSMVIVLLIYADKFTITKSGYVS